MHQRYLKLQRARGFLYTLGGSYFLRIHDETDTNGKTVKKEDLDLNILHL